MDGWMDGVVGLSVLKGYGKGKEIELQYRRLDLNRNGQGNRLS